jgi:polyhydroxybutyrate depolymerase
MRRPYCSLFLALLCGCSRSEPAPDVAVSAPPGPSPPLVAPSAPPRALTSAAPAPSLIVPREQRYEPAGLAPGERRPLLLFLHGLGASGKIAFSGLNLQELGRRERVHIVAPDGNVDSKGRRFWNAHPACCDFDRQGVDDVARLGGLLSELGADPHVDPARVYVVGYSNGGFMAQRLACELGDRIAAVASIAGAGPEPGVSCPSAADIAVLAVHGDADEIVRYQGGHLFDKAELPTHVSAEQTFGDWAKRLSCRAPARPGPSLNLEAKLPGDETETRTFEGCPGGGAALWTVHGGNHYIGMNQTFQREIWSYLAKHAKKRLQSPR